MVFSLSENLPVGGSPGPYPRGVRLWKEGPPLAPYIPEGGVRLWEEGPPLAP